MEANAGQGNGNGGEVTGKNQKNKRGSCDGVEREREGYGTIKRREARARKGRKNCKINVPRSAIPRFLCPTPILASFQRIFELSYAVPIVRYSSRSHWPALRRPGRKKTCIASTLKSSFRNLSPCAPSRRGRLYYFPRAPSFSIMPMTRCVVSRRKLWYLNAREGTSLAR